MTAETAEPPKQRPTFLLEVCLILTNHRDQVLFLKRANTGYMDGYFHVPAGHVENGESISTAASRELLEETGVQCPAEDMTLVCVLQRDTLPPRLAFFFFVERWQGEPYNREPEKCAELVWAKTETMRDEVVDYVYQGIADWQSGRLLACSK
ncbi:MAG TPA: NUDIX domain-containing protein [Pirellulales bacterium]